MIPVTRNAFYLARSRGKRGRLTWSLLIGYWVFSPLEISDKAQIQQLPKPGQALSANSIAKQKYPPPHHRRKQEQVTWERGQVGAEVTAGPRRLQKEKGTTGSVTRGVPGHRPLLALRASPGSTSPE